MRFMKKIKLILSIRSLDIGGAERQFIELAKGIDKDRFEVTVCTMYPGVLDDEVISTRGVEFVCFNKKGRYDLGFLNKYRKFLHEQKPDLIYSWLGEMNLFSLWCKPKTTKLIWGFRASNMDLSRYGRFSRFLFWLQKMSSRYVDRIVANSHAAIAYHKTAGFYMDKSVVIHNGIDIKRFCIDETLRASFRKEHHLQESELAIAMVARLDPMKGYEVFAQAANLLLRRYKSLKFFAAGGGSEAIQKRAIASIDKEVKDRFIWLGVRSDVERIYNGVDIVVSASLFGEGFSNTIAEAMACGVPCVVTDVGDSALIVGKSGVVVKPGDLQELVKGIEKMMVADIKKLGSLARRRIEENFSTDRMVKKTEEVIEQCVAL